MKLFPLTDEQREQIENLAAIGYTPEETGIIVLDGFMNVDGMKSLKESTFMLEDFIKAATDPESNIYYHIRRGQLLAAANEQIKLYEKAGKGDVTASQQLAKIRRSKGWEISKLDIFGGFPPSGGTEGGILQKLEDYIQSGSVNKLSAEEAIYIEALTLFNSLARKYGRRNTIRFFTKEPFNLKYARASEMYDEAIALFYTDRNVEKKALRNLKAEQLDEAAMIVRDNAQSSKDWEVFANITMQSAKLQELDKPDVEKLPLQAYQKPIRVYSLDTESIGLPKIDRQDLANQIEALEIPERDKIRLRKDALIEPFNIQETLDELEEESKSEE